jgi:hypothetical protein
MLLGVDELCNLLSRHQARPQMGLGHKSGKWFRYLGVICFPPHKQIMKTEKQSGQYKMEQFFACCHITIFSVVNYVLRVHAENFHPTGLYGLFLKVHLHQGRRKVRGLYRTGSREVDAKQP